MSSVVESPAPASRRMAVIATSLGALIAAPLCFALVRETDAGWHLAVGRLIVEGEFPRTNALTWTYGDFGWYPTSWLFGVLAYLATRAAGVLGFQLLTFAFVVATLAAVASSCRRLDRSNLGVWPVPLLALLLAPRITERPHVATWAILASVFALSLASTQRFRLRWLTIPLIALGSNFHSGAVFPAIVVAFFCAADVVKGVRRREAIALAAASFLALLANPGGTYNVWYAIEHLSVQSVIRLGEFESPTLMRAPAFYGLVCLTLVLAWLRRSQWPALLPILVAFAGLGMYALRAVYEFEVLATPCLALAIAPLRSRFGSRTALLTTVLLVACAAALRSGSFERLSFGAGFDQSVLPVRAARFIEREKLEGPCFTAFRDGGYLEYALPTVPVFQDARVQAFPASFFADEQEAEKSAPAFRSWLRARGVEWAVASRVNERLAGFRQMRGPDWALVYFDEASEIWLRRDVPHLQDEIARLEYRFWRPDVHPVGLVELLGPRVERLGPELERYLQDSPDDVVALIALCAWRSRVGTGRASEFCGLLERSTDDEVELGLIRQAASLRPLADETREEAAPAP